MNLQQILDNSKLSLEQQFTISSLKQMNLDNISKEELLNVLVKATDRLFIVENMIKQIFKDV